MLIPGCLVGAVAVLSIYAYAHENPAHTPNGKTNICSECVLIDIFYRYNLSIDTASPARVVQVLQFRLLYAGNNCALFTNRKNF